MKRGIDVELPGSLGMTVDLRPGRLGPTWLTKHSMWLTRDTCKRAPMGSKSEWKSCPMQIQNKIKQKVTGAMCTSNKVGFKEETK